MVTGIARRARGGRAAAAPRLRPASTAQSGGQLVRPLGYERTAAAARHRLHRQGLRVAAPRAARPRRATGCRSGPTARRPTSACCSSTCSPTWATSSSTTRTGSPASRSSTPPSSGAACCDLLRLIGYELAPAGGRRPPSLALDVPTPARAGHAVRCPSGAQFAHQPTAAAADVRVPRRRPRRSTSPATGVDVAPTASVVYAGLPVRHGRAVAVEVLGSSTGEPNQTFPLPRAPVDRRLDRGRGRRGRRLGALGPARAPALPHRTPTGACSSRARRRATSTCASTRTARRCGRVRRRRLRARSRRPGSDKVRASLPRRRRRGRQRRRRARSSRRRTSIAGLDAVTNPRAGRRRRRRRADRARACASGRSRSAPATAR